MKVKVSRALAILSIASLSVNPLFAAIPSVTLFEHVGFNGISESFTSGDPDLRDNTIGNDVVSSLKVAEGYTVTLYQHVNYAGVSQTFTAGEVFDLRGNTPIGNDIASSMIVTLNSNTPSVSLFQHVNFGGITEAFVGDDPDLRDNQIGNDEASSIKVQAGCTATLFQHVNYGGFSETFTAGDVVDLRDSTVIIGNDVASSIKVSCGPIIPAPVANNDSGETTVQDTPVTVDVVANDTGDGLTLTSVGSATSGTTSIVNGEVVYTPNSGFVGTDSFTYTVTDSTGAQSQATVSVTVTPTPPVANDDTGVTTVQDTPKTIDVLANDTGDSLTLTSVGSATSGTTSIVNGEVVYTPNSGFVGTDSFTYTVTDSTGAQSQGTVNVTVTAAPAPLEVILYSGQDQTGASQAYPTGDYATFTGSIGNNDPSSIHIPAGCIAEIFRDPNFALVDANHDTITLGEGDFNFPISNASGQMADNAASSMKVDCGGSSTIL